MNNLASPTGRDDAVHFKYDQTLSTNLPLPTTYGLTVS